MKAIITLLATVLGVTACTAATETRQDSVPQKVTMPELTLTGCIVQGSGPTVFIFKDAKRDPKSTTEEGERYLLKAETGNLDLRAHLSHQVRITGQADLRVSAMPVRDPVPSDPNRPADERTLPRFIATSVTMVADKCPAGK